MNFIYEHEGRPRSLHCGVGRDYFYDVYLRYRGDWGERERKRERERVRERERERESRCR
jgi:hypothetical protein